MSLLLYGRQCFLFFYVKKLCDNIFHFEMEIKLIYESFALRYYQVGNRSSTFNNGGHEFFIHDFILFQHFHKAGGTSIVRAARRGQNLYIPNVNGNGIICWSPWKWRMMALMVNYRSVYGSQRLFYLIQQEQRLEQLQWDRSQTGKESCYFCSRKGAAVCKERKGWLYVLV